MLFPFTHTAAELSFFAVAVHEFGHSLGLSHSSVQGAIMYPYYQSLTSEYKLSSDDITGIQAIYGTVFQIKGILTISPLCAYILTCVLLMQLNNNKREP